MAIYFLDLVMLETEHLVRSSLILLLLIPFSLLAQRHPNQEIDSLLRKGIESIVLQNYDGANETFNYLDSLYSENPLGNIYLSATEIAKSVDYEEEVKSEFVDSLLSIAKDKTDKFLDQDGDDLWYNYYDALIYGYKAYYSSISGNLISAFSDGVQSLNVFQNCLEIDNKFYEAYIAYGSYKYWKSAQTKSLLWLPFVSDNRDEGIEFLEKAIESNPYNRHLAAFSLIWIYIDHEKSDLAVDLANKMLDEYKGSRFFMWGLARAYQDIDKGKAISTFKDLLESVQKIENRNQYNDIVLKHKIAMLLYDVGENSKALKLCNEILDFNIKSIKIKERLHSRIIRAEELKNKIMENN